MSEPALVFLPKYSPDLTHRTGLRKFKTCAKGRGEVTKHCKLGEASSPIPAANGDTKREGKKG